MNKVSLEEAGQLLKNGKIGVILTDTVYGIVASAALPKTVGRFYALKEREHKPGTVIAASASQLIKLGVPKAHVQKVQRWWPGPVSVETPLGPELAYLHQQTGRQGFRVVADPRVQKLLKLSGPLVTSSANQPGKTPASNISEAYDYFGNAVDFYVDDGEAPNRAPSTIIRVSDAGIEVIRHGAVKINL